MDSKKVIYPKANIKAGSLDVVFDNGTFSIALLEWANKSETHQSRAAIRWNGGADKSGYPHGRFGRPNWFIIPKEVALSFAKVKGDLKMIAKIEAIDDTPFE